MPKDGNQSRIIAGRYRLADALGAGAQGTVYLAEDLGRGGAHVALKLVEDVVGGPREEPADAILRHFRHPHWAAVLDAGPNHPEGWFQAVELVRGASLDRLEGPQPVEHVWKLLVDLARVLGAMHRQGVLHYDVTPGNVMLDDSADTLRFVLTDGGLAHIGPIEGVARGTPLYMAPEVTEAGGHDHRADLYSLGLVAFRLATGRDPIEGSGSSVLGQRRREDAPRARTLRADLPTELDDLLAALLSRNPNERPHDAFDLIDKVAEASGQDIARFTHAEGVAATEGGAMVGGTDALARIRSLLSVLDTRRRGGPSRLAAVQAPKIDDPVVIVRGASSAGATRVASEALDLARTMRVPALLMAGRDTIGDRRGPLRRLLDGMASLEVAADTQVEPLQLELGRRRELGRDERSHALTRAVEQFVRGVEITAKRTPFLLVVQDFAELSERAQEAVRVLSRHLLALGDHGGSASAPSVTLLVDIGDADADSLLVPDTEMPEQPLLDTPALERDEVLAFLAARFPGIAPDDKDMDRILAVSQGLPGTLSALLAEGSRRGDLVYEAGRWSWNIDTLDGYEIRTGLSRTVAHALCDTSPELMRVLGHLSLAEAPLEASVVEKLWLLVGAGPLPQSPLLRPVQRSNQLYYSIGSRALASAVRPADSDIKQVASELADALTGCTDVTGRFVQARAQLASERPVLFAQGLNAVWPSLDLAQRSRAQEDLAQALRRHPTLAADQVTRAICSRLLEHGAHALECARLIAPHVTSDVADVVSGFRVARVLAESRLQQEALDLYARISQSHDLSANDRAYLAVEQCSLLMELHRQEEALSAHTEARASLRQLRKRGTREWTVLCKFLMTSAQVHFLSGRPRRAMLELQAARKCARSARAPILMARLYSNMGIVELHTGNFERATRKLKRALALRRRLGDLDGVLSTLLNLGRLLQQTGALVKSASVFQEAASHALRHEKPAVLGNSLLFLGQVYDQQMNSRLAAATLARSLTASQRAGTGPSAMRAAWELAPISAALGDVDTSRKMLAVSAAAARHRATTYARPNHHFAAGLVALHLGQDHIARARFQRALRGRDALYERNLEILRQLSAFFEMLGVRELPEGRERPQYVSAHRYAYRIGLWAEQVARAAGAKARLPLAKFLPHPQSRRAANGGDRRLLAEVALRSHQFTTPEACASAVAELDRHLALTGERFLQGRALAVLALADSETGGVRSAQLFSRSIELIDTASPTGESSTRVIPQEHMEAHGTLSGALFGVTERTPSKMSDFHALAHQLLLRHGFSAAPDGRISSALRRVLAATGRMNAGAGLDDLLQGMTEDTIEITGAERACVVLIDPNSAQQMRVEKGSSSQHLGVEVEDLSQTVIQRVIDSGDPLLLHDVFDDAELMGRPSITSLSLRSILCVPMLRGDTLFGVLYADSASAAGSFDSVDQEVLSLFAEQAAAALETHRLVADVQNSMAELRAMQERLVRGERLRTMGELSSGVAHEFNNLLTSILARVQLISLEPVSAELKHDLDLIEKACLDAAEVVRRLQSFTRREREEDFTPVNMREICNDAVEFLRPLWSTRRRHGREPLTVKLRTDENLPIMGNAVELREVVTNLLKNSLDALADGGHIDIEARQIPGGVVLRVEDDGPGIPEDVRARVFDPFFTTKGERGTGLGLCLSQQIVERHGGEMALWSEVGEGTRFTIELPLASERPSANDTAAVSAQPLKVLVVDDDDNVRLPLCRYLERSGYELESAADGEAGLKAVRSERPDVVISDVAMPGMNGIELCSRIQKEIPDVPVILMSGWASGTDPSRARRAGAAALLKKPFALQQVEEALRAVADERNSTRALRRMG